MSVAPTIEGRVPVGWRGILVTGALVASAAVLLVGLFGAYGVDDEKFGFDFRVAYLPAAELVADGRSPYPDDPSAPQPGEFVLYHYPPTLAVLLIPLTALSVNAAAIGAVLVSLAALMAALAVLGVRDVRCYAVLILWAPSWNALEMANVSAVFALGAALVWRFRSRLVPLGLTLGALVSVKLFLWPLLVWAAATRRATAAAGAGGLALVATAASWATIGFAGIGSYPEFLSEIAHQASYSIEDMAQVLGLGAGVGRALSVAVGGGLLAWSVALARKEDEERAFFVAIAAALAFSPIVWQHYLVLLAVPLAIARPRFSPLWLLPIVLWVCPRFGNGDGLETFLPAAVAVTVLGSLVVRARESSVAVAT
jgi:alpha-1,2-mannosyltransferase